VGGLRQNARLVEYTGKVGAPRHVSSPATGLGLDARENRQGYAHEKWTTSRLLSDYVELACDPRRQDFGEICP
jgi:hypothetical protein